MKQAWILMVAMFTYFTFSALAFGQDVPVEGMEWITSVINFLNSIPQAQPILSAIFIAAGTIVIVATALVVLLKTLLTIPQIAAKWAGAENFAKKLKAFEDKILPWIVYLSLFKSQKKK